MNLIEEFSSFMPLCIFKSQKNKQKTLKHENIMKFGYHLQRKISGRNVCECLHLLLPLTVKFNAFDIHLKLPFCLMWVLVICIICLNCLMGVSWFNCLDSSDPPLLLFTIRYVHIFRITIDRIIFIFFFGIPFQTFIRKNIIYSIDFVLIPPICVIRNFYLGASGTIIRISD